jgi:hypothetical protein
VFSGSAQRHPLEQGFSDRGWQTLRKPGESLNRKRIETLFPMSHCRFARTRREDQREGEHQDDHNSTDDECLGDPPAG